jgi:uncharacterized protein (UPF0332 family)
MSKWLLDRLYDHKHQPTARFAFQGSINWVHGLSILVDSELFLNDNLKDHYKNVTRRNVNEVADTRVYENILLSLHNISALQKFAALENNHYDVVRSAIVSWYYAIYYASKAMIAATSESDPQTHTDAAKVWQNNIADRGFAIEPFNLSILDIRTKYVKAVITKLRAGNKYDINNYPGNIEEAKGCIFSYFQGTTSYTKWQIEEKIRESKEFKELSVTDFRKKDAREMRDRKLQSGMVNFLTQAFRYRGKANYRDSIYLSYGDNREAEIEVLIKDLENIALKFLKMASFYASRRVEKGTWKAFVDDIDGNSQLAISSQVLGVKK